MLEARAVFLDDDEMARILDEAESKEAGSGWGGGCRGDRAAPPTEGRGGIGGPQRGLDLLAVYEAARDRDEDRLDFPEEATSTGKAGIILGARAVFLDDDEIAGILRRGGVEGGGLGLGGGCRGEPRSADSRRTLPKPRPEPST